MTFSQLLMLLGGLALFLYGMKMMSDGLEQAAGDRMKKILEKLTSNRFLGVVVGALITAVVQSSSATTVMVVGFVNSGLMTLRQAIWVIMGANVGTTITGQLIALDVGDLAPILAIIGVVMIVFIKTKRVHHIGGIIGGLGILFIGMTMMGDSMKSLRDSEVFVEVVSNLSNPLIGVLVGAIFTAIIQSSSASVGILQALAMSGTIQLSNAVYVLFGQNIGTCITALIASIGTNRNARRTTIIHLLFNVIGTTIFVVGCQFIPFTEFVQSLTPNNVPAQIANVHTIFNVVTLILLLPFGTLLEKIAKKVLPEIEGEVEEKMELKFISPSALGSHSIGTASIAISQINSEVERMYKLASTNVDNAFANVLEWSEELSEKIKKDEEYVDFLNAEISTYIATIMTNELTENDALKITSYFKIITNIERISDHADNISGYATTLNGKKSRLSQLAVDEIHEMREAATRSLKLLDVSHQNVTEAEFSAIAKAEEEIDDLTEKYRTNQIDRIKNNKCGGSVSVIYSEMLTDFERIGDHLLNIAELMSDTQNNLANGKTHN